MLRTNLTFLAYAKELYDNQQRKEAVVVKHYAPGQRLLNQGETAAKVMLISEGITKCFLTENNDKEFILEFLGAGEIIGDIELIRNIPCLCNIEAMTDVTVYAFSLPYFEDLLKKDTEVTRLLLNAYAERIVNTSSRASYQQLHTVEHSLSKLLDLQLKHQLHISKEDMAAYLGITVRSLNRTLKDIKE